MANMEGFRAADMRESNEKLVKRFLMEYGECTKMDIAGGLGLSHPTVAKVLADMAARGEAESAGKEDSLGGRSGEKYRLNYDHTHVLAIILTLDRLQYRVVNLARRTKEEGSLPVVGQTHIARMAELVSDVRGRFPNIRLIELGMSGTVLDGRLLYISQADFYLVGSDVAGELEKRCQLPVEAVNDVNAMAFGFFRRHIEVSLKNDSMAYLFQNRTGPGSGIIVDGKIVNGFSGFAGEVANVWPPQESLTDQIKSQVAAIISVVNPRFLVISHDRQIPVDREAVRAFVRERFPAHSVPRFPFSRSGEGFERLRQLVERGELLPGLPVEEAFRAGGSGGEGVDVADRFGVEPRHGEPEGAGGVALEHQRAEPRLEGEGNPLRLRLLFRLGQRGHAPVGGPVGELDRPARAGDPAGDGHAGVLLHVEVEDRRLPVHP